MKLNETIYQKIREYGIDNMICETVQDNVRITKVSSEIVTITAFKIQNNAVKTAPELVIEMDHANNTAEVIGYSNEETSLFYDETSMQTMPKVREILRESIHKFTNHLIDWIHKEMEFEKRRESVIQ